MVLHLNALAYPAFLAALTMCVSTVWGPTSQAEHHARGELPGGRILAEYVGPNKEGPLGAQDACPGCVLSTVTILGAFRGNGSYLRQRYRFENVHFSSNDTLTAYLPPEIPQPVPHVVDTVHGTASAQRLPTAVVYDSITKRRQIRLDIEYRYAQMHAPPRCLRWEERPAYLLQIPHVTNIWHSFNDGLVGAFSTLREEGLLPLAEIDAHGNMKEYTADLDTEGCPRVIQPGSGGQPLEAQRAQHCRKVTEVVTQTRCDPVADVWCKEGLVAVHASRGPIILRANGTLHMPPQWEGMLRAISDDVRGWRTMAGVCFRELYVGKSNALNFYVALNAGVATAEKKAAQVVRARTMAAFQRLMATSQLAARQTEQQWGGYPAREVEVLRRGVGPEHVDVVEVLRRLRSESIAEAAMEPEDEAELRAALAFSRRETKRAVLEMRQGVPAAVRVGAANRKLPTVTFMWRSGFRRAILNEADLLMYVLTKYAVTLRVTTFEEPMLETMQLMGATDVLIGMHGAGWSNAMFLKPGGVALQMFPFGWRPQGTNRTIRGYAYEAIVQAQNGTYTEWVNPFPRNAFMRDADFDYLRRKGRPVEPSLHPLREWPMPSGNQPGSHWIYQNTVVNITDFARVLDNAMQLAGIPSMVQHIQ